MISALLLAVATALPAAQHLSVMTVHAPKAAVVLQIATTESERELGLMSVTKLPEHTGMVFVFDKDDQVEFWMKDTLIPLDMIWVAADGTVRSIAQDVPVVSLGTPDNAIPLRHGQGKFVIELPAFEAAHDGIVPGVRLSELVPLHT